MPTSGSDTRRSIYFRACGAQTAWTYEWVEDDVGLAATDDEGEEGVFCSGTWDSGMLDAAGSGRVALSTFWQQDDRQYAAGSLMWSDGNVSTLVLVRP